MRRAAGQVPGRHTRTARTAEVDEDGREEAFDGVGAGRSQTYRSTRLASVPFLQLAGRSAVSCRHSTGARPPGGLSLHLGRAGSAGPAVVRAGRATATRTVPAEHAACA